MHAISKCKRMFLRALLVLCLCYLPTFSFAQMGEPALQIVNDLEAYKPNTALSAHSNELMGETISMDTGEISFSATDVSLPGNSNLPVEIRRVATAGTRDGNHDMLDWRIDIPRIQINTFRPTLRAFSYPGTSISLNGSPKWPNSRCTHDPRPGGLTVSRGNPLVGVRTVKNMDPTNFFGGLRLQGVPGSGKMQKADPANAANHGTVSPKWVTKTFWKFTCLGNVSGGTGQGYLGYAPDGTTYRFDVLRYEEKYQAYSWPVEFPDLGPSHRAVLYVSEVTDVHGNWVKYEYDNDGLTRIHANDGREITLTYGLPDGVTGNVTTRKRVLTVSANGRTWSYDYGPYNLTEVTLPDGRKWEYGLTFHVMSDHNAIDFENECMIWEAGYYERVHNVKHPDGTVGEFTEIPDLIFNGYKDAYGNGNGHPDEYDNCTGLHAELPFGAYTPALESKKLTLSDGTTSIWTYAYEELPGNYYSEGGGHPSDTKKRTIIGPTGTKTVHHVNRQARAPHSAWQGTIVKTEIFETASATTPIKTITKDFLRNDNFGGTSYAAEGENTSVSVIALLPEKITINQDGDTYTTEYDYNTDAANSSFSFAKPIQTQVYSSVNGSTTPRVRDMTYENNEAKWIINLPKTITINGSLKNTFNYYPANGKMKEFWEYGVKLGEYEYYTTNISASPNKLNAAGRPSKMTDAEGRISEVLEWERGSPVLVKQAVNTADEITWSQTVDDNGWTTSRTDPKGITTSYDYDKAGRVTKIIPHQNVAPAITRLPTTINYYYSGDGVSQVQGGMYQMIQQGYAREIVRYDSLLRPYEEITIDRQQAYYSYVNTEYDGIGRVSFKSFPDRHRNFNDGTRFTYDALGRMLSSVETVGSGASTIYDYLSNNRTAKTDAEGHTTTTWRNGYGGPGGSEAIKIQQPEGVNTIINRNIFGEIESVTQSGSNNGFVVNETQTFAYDDRRRICRYYTPEAGSTLYAYNNANEVTSHARVPGSVNCTTSPSGATKVTLTYDAMGRLKNTVFADSATKDIFRAYDDNGNLKQLTRGVSTEDNWTRHFYDYDDYNDLAGEKLIIQEVASDASSQRNFDIDYYRNVYGHLRAKRLPSGRIMPYLHNSQGQTMRVGFAGNPILTGTAGHFGAKYHPTGALEAAKYGNGQVFTQTFNTRQQPLRMLTSKGGVAVVDLTYSYDLNGRITGQSDGVIANNTRNYAYDDLGRLKTASSAAFGTNGAFTYDALGNLRKKIMNRRIVTMDYNGDNRLISANDTRSGNRTLQYDARGNVTKLGNLNFIYDMANQPRTIYGQNADGEDIGGQYDNYYVYDGNMKRVKSVVNGRTIFNVYDAAGMLVHVEESDDPDTPEIDYAETDYIHANGQTIARIKNGTFTYLHPDHLGSAQAGTKGDGYAPDGEFLNFVAKFVVDVGLEVAIQAATGQEIDLGAAAKGAALGVLDPTKTARKAAKLAGALNDVRKANKVCCFVAGTLVETKDGLRPIEDIEVGDLVWARDEETGEEALKPVLGLILLHDRVIWDLETVSETGEAHTFGTTDDHPWWVEGHGWKRTDELGPKDILVTLSGEKVSISSVTNTNVIEPTFNFEVADFNTYFVGESKVWVHNAACDLPKLPRGKGSVPPSQRDPKRGLNKTQRADLLESQDGKCAGCKEPKSVDEVASHHLTRHADGGKTVPEDMAAVCDDCHKYIHGKD